MNQRRDYEGHERLYFVVISNDAIAVVAMLSEDALKRLGYHRDTRLYK